MCDYMRKACDDFAKATNRSFKHVPTPYIPERGLALTEAREALPGKFGESAAHYLMTLLYGARMARPELAVAITRLASRVSKWSAECDERLIRLYDFIHDRIELCIYGSLSTRDATMCEIWAWPDADLAGDKLFSSKSTSGRFIELVGADGRGFPLQWSTHKQGATALSTPEAETVSLSDCCKADALPVQSLLSLLLQRPVVLRALEDNTTCIRSVEKGYSQAMRYLSRTQRTSLGFLNEIFSAGVEGSSSNDSGGGSDGPSSRVGATILQYAPTKLHKGDFFTKDSLTQQDYIGALESIRMYASLEDFERGERNKQAQNSQICGPGTLITPAALAAGLAQGQTPFNPNSQSHPSEKDLALICTSVAQHPNHLSDCVYTSVKVPLLEAGGLTSRYPTAHGRNACPLPRVTISGARACATSNKHVSLSAGLGLSMIRMTPGSASHSVRQSEPPAGTMAQDERLPNYKEAGTPPADCGSVFAAHAENPGQSSHLSVWPEEGTRQCRGTEFPPDCVVRCQLSEISPTVGTKPQSSFGVVKCQLSEISDVSQTVGTELQCCGGSSSGSFPDCLNMSRRAESISANVMESCNSSSPVGVTLKR